MKIDSNTSLYCIFGKPVNHSLSPIMHNSAFSELGINAVYLAFESYSIEKSVSAVRSLGIKGCSITIPYKTEVMEYIDDIDPLAADIGAVNTLKNVDGKISGYNTDGAGVHKALVDSGIDLSKSTVLILGNGGSARSISYTLLSNNASVIISGRNQTNMSSLLSDLKSKYSKVDSIINSDLDQTFMKRIDIIINTTPVGMNSNEMPISESLIEQRHTVFDIVYSPDITSLLEAAVKKNCRIIKGIEMLINQGAMQFEIWTGMKAPLLAMRNAVHLHKKL